MSIQLGQSGEPSALRRHFSSRLGLRRFGQVLAVLCLALTCRVGWAGTLYRCTGSLGELVYSSSRVGYRDCKSLQGGNAPSHVLQRPSLMHVAGAIEMLHPQPAPADIPALDHLLGSVEIENSVPLSAPLAAPADAGKWIYRENDRGLNAGAVPAPAASSADRVLRGTVYRLRRADGTVEYTNVKPADAQARVATILFTYIASCVACNLHSTINFSTVPLNLAAYADSVHAASVEFGIEEGFLRAIIHAESAYNPRALSYKGAQGLMQLMPFTANDMGVRDAFDAADNIRGGARYLALLLHSFNGDERLAAAAYNAGAGAVQRYKGVPPYAETQVYVERVGLLRRRYVQAMQALR